MARYYPVSPLFWSDPKVRRWNDRPRLLALYLLTCKHRNLEGLYWLPYAYIAADLKWSTPVVEQTMAELSEDGFLKYDPDAEVVFVRNALKYQAPQSKAQVKGALSALQTVPSTPLLDAFVEAAENYAPPLRTALKSVITSPNGSGKP